MPASPRMTTLWPSGAPLSSTTSTFLVASTMPWPPHDLHSSPGLLLRPLPPQTPQCACTCVTMPGPTCASFISTPEPPQREHCVLCLLLLPVPSHGSHLTGRRRPIFLHAHQVSNIHVRCTRM